MSIANSNDIKNIPDIPEDILIAASSGKLVVFVGAGVSKLLGCPTWKEFAEKQLEYLYENKGIKYYEYEKLKRFDARKLLSVCRELMRENKIKPPDLASFFEGDDKLREKCKIYDDLYSLNCIYVTTNYDDHFDRVAEKVMPEQLNPSLQPASSLLPAKSAVRNKVVYLKEDLLLSHLINGKILHLHGSVREQAEMIITIVDYIKHYEPNSKASVLLEEIFKSYTVIFVGYGLEEYEILEFIIRKSHPVIGELQHFMLYPVFKSELKLLQLQKKYYATLGVQLVPYPIDDNGYEHLVIVIREWTKQIGPIAKPPAFYNRIKLIDEVI